jgi:hypothetical protein
MTAHAALTIKITFTSTTPTTGLSAIDFHDENKNKKTILSAAIRSNDGYIN